MNNRSSERPGREVAIRLLINLWNPISEIFESSSTWRFPEDGDISIEGATPDSSEAGPEISPNNYSLSFLNRAVWNRCCLRSLAIPAVPLCSENRAACGAFCRPLGSLDSLRCLDHRMATQGANIEQTWSSAQLTECVS